jgi:hypothetical protein
MQISILKLPVSMVIRTYTIQVWSFHSPGSSFEFRGTRELNNNMRVYLISACPRGFQMPVQAEHTVYSGIPCQGMSRNAW